MSAFRIRRMVEFAMLVLAMSAPAMPGWSQVPELAEGTPVRLRIEGGAARLTGTVVAPAPGGFQLRDANGATIGISWDEIRRLDRGHPRTSGQGALNGLGWGLMIGAGILGPLAAITYEDYQEPEGHLFGCMLVCSRGQSFVAGAAFGAVAGGVVGTILGVVQPGVHWKKVPLEINASGTKSGLSVDVGGSVRF